MSGAWQVACWWRATIGTASLKVTLERINLLLQLFSQHSAATVFYKG